MACEQGRIGAFAAAGNGKAMNRNHERLVEHWPTRAYLFDWRIGQRVRTATGDLFEVVEVPAVEPGHNRVVVLQKLVLDEQRRPIPRLRERALIRAVAERDVVQVAQSVWARRIPQEDACAG
jgi:hypothetical protein